MMNFGEILQTWMSKSPETLKRHFKFKERDHVPSDFGDIPDDLITKKHIFLGKNTWLLYRQFGYEFMEAFISSLHEHVVTETINKRLKESIILAKEESLGRLEKPEKTLTHWILPPIRTVVANQNQGAVKYFFGESCDVSFIIIDDYRQDIPLVLTCHVENGLPVDFWIINQDSPEMTIKNKEGIEFRNLPKKLKTLGRCSIFVKELLNQFRSERSPEWSTSAHYLFLGFNTGLYNLIAEPSNFELEIALWDAMNAAKHGLPTAWFVYTPWPPMLKNLLNLDRKTSSLRALEMFTKGRLHVLPIEESTLNWLNENYPEVYRGLLAQRAIYGIPSINHTLNCKIPDYSDESTFLEKKFSWKYPKEKKIFPGDMGMSVEDTFKGVYLDVDSKTPIDEKITKKHILSIGIGRETKFPND
ncbi:MAG: hypothetical protein ACTSRW_04415 [Candidatus Helarchaeota archaeon]